MREEAERNNNTSLNHGLHLRHHEEEAKKFGKHIEKRDNSDDQV